MIIREIADGKECFLPLLLVGDEQEDMIRRYLDCGRLFILEHDGLKAAAVVTDEGGGICEVRIWRWKRNFKDEAMEAP